MDVVLVSVPWAPAHEPSLALALLKPTLARAGLSCRIYHCGPRLLRWLSIETYEYIASSWALNEFVFSGVIEPLCDDQQLLRLDEQVSRYCISRPNPKYGSPSAMCELYLRVRHEVIPKFIDYCADEILALSPRLVGFTCMFDQTVASAALAHALKSRDDHVQTVFGGYALEGPPGVVAATAFPWIDAIVQGDGEHAIVELAHTAARALSIRDSSGSTRIVRGQAASLSESPTPDYSDWFAELNELAESQQVHISPAGLPVESSRGCWWGQVKHCVFCGIDDDTLKYRSKSATATLAMLREVRERYGDFVFRFSDYIMPKAYYRELLPVLASEEPRFRLHSEIKANQTPERLKLLADAGFVELQPGIESFSTGVLRAMDKGVRAIDNVMLLKHGYLNRIVVHYNILFGLPSDGEVEYQEMLRRLPMLYHLAPPVSCNETVVTRFAPLQSDPGRFGIGTRARHHRAYDAIFSRKFCDDRGFDLDRYAYYFERNFEYKSPMQALYSQLAYQVSHWKRQLRDRSVELCWQEADSKLIVSDSRFGETLTYELVGTSAAVYLACDQAPASESELASIANSATIGCVLDELEDRRLIWREGSWSIGLAVPSATAECHRRSGWLESWPSIYD